jgi:UV excision repair protein RAD23
MKLTFKDLKQQKFFIEAEPSETIGALKEKILAEKGWEIAQQKLIYSGKILQDQNTISSYNIEEKGFIVCMISKPKATPATTEATGSSASTPKNAVPSTPARQTAPVSTPSAPVAAASSRTQNVPETPTPAGSAPPAAEGASSQNFNDPSALAMGAQREAAISNMLEMGYDRESIDRAMRAAFYNPDRAVEYLLVGIPEHLQQEQRQAPPAAAPAARPAAPAQASPAAASPAAAPQAAAAPPAEGENVNLFEAAATAARQRQQGGGAGAGAGLGHLEFLRNNPQFQQLRQVVQQQPQMLEPVSATS